MSREVRMVPANWQHPDNSNGHTGSKPLHENYNDAKQEFEAMQSKQGLQEALEYFGEAPSTDDYMPEWEEKSKTHYMMYETCSEGTPISPPMETPELLAQWLVDNNASAFGGQGASYEGWLNVANGGYAPSMVMSGGVMQTGVDAFK